jgi:hypothetical protein
MFIPKGRLSEVAEFHYEVAVSLESDKGCRGERVTARVKFDNPNEAVKRAMARISEYGIYESLKAVDSSTFVWSYLIPYEAPVGNYTLEFFGINQDGAKGPIQKTTFIVVG